MKLLKQIYLKKILKRVTNSNKVKVLTKKRVKEKVKKIPIKNKKIKKEISLDKSYRDFRYGAPFVWDYSPMIPIPEKIINIERKTPDYFYKIKDRERS